MQIEIKCAIDFLLSYLYDKLPRRRVNLFGEELQKYLKLKLIASDAKVALNINFKQNNIELIDPCLIAASKESAMDLNEILECWPTQLKLFVEAGLVSYSLGQDLNQPDGDHLKIVYDETNETSGPVVTPMTGAVQGANVQPMIQAAISSTHSGGALHMDANNNQHNLFDLLNKGIDFNNIQQSNNNPRALDKNNIQFASNVSSTSRASYNTNTSNNNNMKSRGLNLNFKNLNTTPYNVVYNSSTSPGSFNNIQLGETSPFQQTDFGLLSSSSSSASTSSSSSHLSNPPTEDPANKQQTGVISPGPALNSNIAALTSATPKLQCAASPMFTTSAFAQTKFGSTKSKNNYPRQAKQQKMLPNEFSAYIRNKVKLLNGQPQQQQSQINMENQGMANNLNVDTSFIPNYSLMNDQVPSISLSSYSSVISPPPVPPFQSLSGSAFFNKNGLPEYQSTSPYNTTSSINGSQFIQADYLFGANQNSAMNELEENLINNYFSTPFSSSSSSTVSSASSSLSSYNNSEKQLESDGSKQQAINDLLSANSNLLNQINNLTI